MFLIVGNLITIAIFATASLHPQHLVAGSLSAQMRPCMRSSMPDARHSPPTSYSVTLSLASLPSSPLQGDQCHLSSHMPESLSPFQQLHSFTQRQGAWSCLKESFLWGLKVAPLHSSGSGQAHDQLPLCDMEIPALPGSQNWGCRFGPSSLGVWGRESLDNSLPQLNLYQTHNQV